MRVSAAVTLLSALSISPAAAQYYPNTTTTAPAGAAATPYQVQTPPLDTPWTYEVGTDPWPQYPRPQLRREAWKNLNGIWTFEPAPAFAAEVPAVPSAPLAQEVLIPSCIESGLSGVQDLNTTNMWFATSFTVPSDWCGQSVLLNFEAVDYEATVFINGQQAGFHRGGYFRFTVDATQYVNFNGTNQL